MNPDAETRLRPPLPLDLGLTLAQLRHGRADPTIVVAPGRVQRATRTPLGPATLDLQEGGASVAVRAWGPGAGYATEAAAALIGCNDDLEAWEPCLHPLIRQLDRRFAGLRVVSTGAVLEAAVPAVIEQKVTSIEAHRSWRMLVRGWGEPAPGPFPLMIPPPAPRLASEPYHRYHRLGIERRRADCIRRLAARAGRVEEAPRLEGEARRARLEAFGGVGPWTSAEVASVAWGDADAVSVGDYHLAPTVVYAFTGLRGGDDEAMLELLEPFRPHRGRVCRLVMLSGLAPPKRAPRARLRDFSSF